MTPGQGVAALQMLNIMETSPLFQYRPQSADALHAKKKLAYSDLQRYIADPRFAKIPLEGLLSKEYAKERSALIDRTTARCELSPGTPPRSGGDTIYLSVVDRDGNIASLIQSLYLSFGSGVLVEGMGFHLQNRGALFEMDADHPNVVAPRKRPLHTIIPAFMEKENIHIGFGIMGGYNQAQAHAQFVSNLVDHNMNIQGGLEAPRFTKLSFGGCDAMIENRVPWMAYGQVVINYSVGAACAVPARMVVASRLKIVQSRLPWLRVSFFISFVPFEICTPGRGRKMPLSPGMNSCHRASIMFTHSSGETGHEPMRDVEGLSTAGQ